MDRVSGFLWYSLIVTVLWGSAIQARVTVSFIGPDRTHITYSAGPYTDEDGTLRLEFGVEGPDGGWTVLQEDTSSPFSLDGQFCDQGLESGTYIYKTRRLRELPENTYKSERSTSKQKEGTTVQPLRKGETVWETLWGQEVVIDGESAVGMLLQDEALSDFAISPGGTITVPDGITLTVNGDITQAIPARDGAIQVKGSLMFAGAIQADDGISFFLLAPHSLSGFAGGAFYVNAAGHYEFTDGRDFRLIPNLGTTAVRGAENVTLELSSLQKDAKLTLARSSFTSMSGKSMAGEVIFEAGEFNVLDHSSIRFGGETVVIFKQGVTINSGVQFLDQCSVHVDPRVTFNGRVAIEGDGTTDSVTFQSNRTVFSDMMVTAAGKGNVEIKNGLFPGHVPGFSIVTVTGGYPEFSRCEFGGMVSLRNRSGAVFENCIFLDAMSFTNIPESFSYPEGFARWDLATSPSPVILHNAFLGEFAFYTPNLSADVPIGRNYYGDAAGYQLRTQLSNYRDNYLGHSWSLGAIYLKNGSGILNIEDAHTTSPVPLQRRDKRVPPKFWVAGHIAGQNTIDFTMFGSDPPMLKGRDTLLSIHLVSSDDFVSGVRVYATVGGTEIEALKRGAPVHRDHSLYTRHQVRAGAATFNIVLPATTEDSMTAQVYLDVSSIPGYASGSGDRHLLSKTLEFSDPPDRPLKILVVPTQVRGLLGLSWGTPSVSNVITVLRQELPEMLPLPASKLDVRQAPQVTYWSPLSSISALGLMNGIAAGSGLARHQLARGGEEVPDFLIYVLPSKLCTAYFPDTWFDRQSFDGAMFSYSSRVLFVAEHRADAVLHELGHGVGLYLDREQYHRYPEYGKPVEGVTRFSPESSGALSLTHFARPKDFWYDNYNVTYDIMGNMSGGQPPVWTLPSTVQGFQTWFRDNLSTSSKGSEPAVRPSAAQRDSGRRILLSGTTDFRRLVPHMLTALALDPSDIQPVPPDYHATFNTQRLIAFNAMGERVQQQDFYPPYRESGWKATVDVPLDTVSLCVMDIARRQIWDPESLSFIVTWNEGAINTFVESAGLKSTELVTPIPGDVIGQQFEAEWTVESDAPVEPGRLHHILYYRTDPTDRWTVGMTTAETRVSASSSFLPQTASLDLRLVTSDGVRHVDHIIEGLSVAARAPEVSILTPRPGDRALLRRSPPATVIADQDASSNAKLVLERGVHGLDRYRFSAVARATDLLGLEIKTTWGATMTTDGILPVDWEGGPHSHDAGRYTVNAFSRPDGLRIVKIESADLAQEDWESMETDEFEVTVQRESGVWAASLLIAEAEMPTETPVIVFPANGESDVEPYAVFSWEDWSEPGSQIRVRVTDDIGEPLDVTTLLLPDATAWRSSALTGCESYRFRVDFLNLISDSSSDLQVDLASYTAALESSFAMVPERVVWTLTAAAESYGGAALKEGTWFSSLDGELGRGSSIEATLSQGEHVLRYEVASQSGETGSAEVTVSVLEEITHLDLTLEDSDLTLHSASTDPSGYAPIWIVPNEPNTVSLRVRNQGLDAVAGVHMFVQGPVDDEIALGEAQLTMTPFEDAQANFSFEPLHAGTYTFRALVEQLKPETEAPAAVEHEWVFSSPADPTVHAVSASASPLAGGVISGATKYVENSTVTLTAAAVPGAQFVNWIGEDGAVISTEPAYTFSVTADRSLTANFEMDEYAVVVQADPGTDGWVTGGGTYTHGEQVQLNAHSYTYSRFVQWTENGDVISTDAILIFTATAGRTLTAHFELNQYDIAVAAEPQTHGLVSGDGTYPHGADVTVTATPHAPFHFQRWTEDGQMVSAHATYVFSATGARSLVAHFVEASAFESGTGTETDPYRVATRQQLESVRYFPEGYFRLIADLDLGLGSPSGGEGWIPIGWTDNPFGGDDAGGFSGVFDGGGHVIHNLTIQRPDTDLQGLFGLLSGGTIRNLVLDAVQISGSQMVGALAGMQSAGTILNCHVTGVINANATAGGLVGEQSGDGTIASCSSSADVTGNGPLGGLVGVSDGAIRVSHASGAVHGVWNVGGLVGMLRGGRIENSYALGSVSAAYQSVGGLVGGGIPEEGSRIVNSYAAGLVVSEYDNGGGLVGEWGWDEDDAHLSLVENSYWNLDTSGLTQSAAGQGRTVEEMTYPYADNTYVNWDFETIWTVGDGASLPGLSRPVPTREWVLTVSLDGISPSTLILGMRTDATDGWDEGIDAAHPLPQSGEACLATDDLAMSYSTDFRGVAEQADFRMIVRAADEEDAKISWGSTILPHGKYLTVYEVILDSMEPSGDVIPTRLVGATALNMEAGGSMTIPAGSTRSYVIRYAHDLVYDLAVEQGWNLVSLPLEPTASGVDAILAGTANGHGSISSGGTVWQWIEHSYQPTENMKACTGYWIFISDAARTLVLGQPVAQSSLNLHRGWNVIGVEKATRLPADAHIRGTAWVWKPATQRFERADVLLPGVGYLINARESAMLPLSP